MSATPIDVLLTPVSEDEEVADITTTCVSLGTPADKWRIAGAMSSFRRAVARTIAGFSNLLVQAIGGFWVDTATAGWLKRLALLVYGVQVPEATFATGQLTLVNGGGGVFPFILGAKAFFYNSTTKALYQNASDFTLNALATLTIDIEAVAAGSASTSPPGGIDSLQTAMLGVTCSNALAVIGTDAPLDAQIRTFCRTTLGAASVRGPKNAYLFFAQFTIDPVTGLGVPLLNALGDPVNINRVAVTPASHTGDVTVTVASPAGAVIAADLTAADANIQTRAVPDGIDETTQSAAVVPYGPTLTVWCVAAPGLVASNVQAAVQAAISAYLQTYPIGGITKGSTSALWGSGIDGVCKGANPNIFAVDGASDLTLIAGQVAGNATTVNVRMVTPS
jgi:hypothetical protein